MEGAEKSIRWFVSEFHKWMDDRLKQTMDEVFFAHLQFTKLMRRYRLFRLSVRNGDAIAIEWLYRQHLPIFHALRKSHYYEIGLSAMEEMYGKIPFNVLQLC